MVFVDTNVLVYATTPQSPHHAAAVQALAGEPARIGAAISRQVLREYLAVMSRVQVHGGPPPQASLADAVTAFEAAFTVLEDGPAVTAALVRLLLTVPVGGKQVHDANLVATMQVHGVTRLLTHNVADFQRFGSLVEVLPLAPLP